MTVIELPRGPWKKSGKQYRIIRDDDQTSKEMLEEADAAGYTRNPAFMAYRKAKIAARKAQIAAREGVNELSREDKEIQRVNLAKARLEAIRDSRLEN